MNENVRSQERLSNSDGAKPEMLEGPQASLLERLTAVILGAVILALGWIVLVAYRPEWLRWFPVEAEITIVLALLAMALLLVSVVALLHTRS